MTNAKLKSELAISEIIQRSREYYQVSGDKKKNEDLEEEKICDKMAPYSLSFKTARCSRHNDKKMGRKMSRIIKGGLFSNPLS